MASNLRAKPIEGHVTDSAGNILRNAKITIKQATPSGSFPVDTVSSDDSGYFQTKPIPNGVYDIYESGVVIARTVHTADRNSIQCFKADRGNYNVDTLRNFTTLADSTELSDYKAFLQIEQPEVDVEQYGSSFPIYNFNITNDTNLDEVNDELFHLSQFLGLNTDSRITTTRFDVEYFAPLTALSNEYKRIRWAGVPGIRYYQDSKLVLPLDYFSMVFTLPKLISPPTGNFLGDPAAVTISGSEDSWFGELNKGTNPPQSYTDLVEKAKKGDVLKVFVGRAGEYQGYWYGIATEVDKSDKSIRMEKLPSSRFTATVNLQNVNDWYAQRILLYDGMFPGIIDINESANERFSVVENVNAQDNTAGELYNYNSSIIARS